MDLASAIAGAQRAEVDFSGIVTTRPRFFWGTRTHCTHEEFGVQTTAGAVDVIDNVALAPRVPVTPGDEVNVRGEYVADGGKAVIHWTHHDPAHHHPDGFIRLRGRTYA
ncbi:MAG: hypothetical protein NVS1B14_08750 [Vulcanimicrobiaceae bacterium]